MPKRDLNQLNSTQHQEGKCSNYYINYVTTLNTWVRKVGSSGLKDTSVLLGKGFKMLSLHSRALGQ